MREILPSMTSRIFPQLKRFYGPQTSANSHTKIRVFRTPNNDFDLLTKGFKLSGAKNGFMAHKPVPIAIQK
ncbi:MAG: hypothetical protein B6247_21145 [Candidatus Parabeggiatoa sp. nov. 2]|nr:MAG: hypothetical protein B6247_21145 [Beggiatoa sp. 4572_84]